VVSYWDGDRWTPVKHPAITWATESAAPTVITFSRVHTTKLRLDLTSAAPGAASGAQRISALAVTGG
jgi:beta-galactosidase